MPQRFSLVFRTAHEDCDLPFEFHIMAVDIERLTDEFPCGRMGADLAEATTPTTPNLVASEHLNLQQ